MRKKAYYPKIPLSGHFFLFISSDTGVSLPYIKVKEGNGGCGKDWLNVADSLLLGINDDEKICYVLPRVVRTLC